MTLLPPFEGQPPATVVELLRAEIGSGARRRLLLVPPGMEAWAERDGAPALDARLAVMTGEVGEALAEAGAWDAIVALFAGDAVAGGGNPYHELAAGLHRALRRDGRALVVTALAAGESGPPAGPPPYEALVAALAENRFLVRKELRADGSALPWAGDRRPGGSQPSILVAQAHSITVRGYRPGDEVPLLELFRRCFHADRSLEHWRWKFEDAPAGRLRISLAAAEGGLILAHYGAFPNLWWDQNERRLLRAHQIGDIMSAPEARGLGRGKTSVLAQTARHFYAAHCHGRVDFNYGFHTAHSRGFSNRFLAVVNPEAVPYRSLRTESFTVPGARGFRVRPLHRAGPELDGLWRGAKGDYGRLAVRDRRYVDWRYFRRPDLGYLVLGVFRWRRLVGWNVFLRRGDQVIWVDAFYRRRAAPAAGPSLAAALDRLGAPSRVTGWFPPRPSWWHAELETLGFVEAPEPDDLDLGIVSFSGPTDGERFRRDLYYTMGDSDLY